MLISDQAKFFVKNCFEGGGSSLLLRRFVFRMAEASAKRVTGDEPQGTMGRYRRQAKRLPDLGCLPFDRKIRLGCRKHNGKRFTSLPQNCHIRYGLNPKRGEFVWRESGTEKEPRNL